MRWHLGILVFLLVLNVGCDSQKSGNINSADYDKIKHIIHNPASATGTDNEDGPKLEVQNGAKFVFDEIDQGGKVKHRFVIENTGNEPLIIFNTSSSCGCTTPYYSKENIAPGDTSHVKVIFDTTNWKGEVRKTVSIHTNCYPNETILALTGIINTI